MANSDKNIWITPNNGSSTADPKIVFSGADASTVAQNITCQVYPTNGGTLSFEGSVGQLFSIANNMTGTIFSVNDISGIPSIEVFDSGQVNIAQYGGNTLIGSGNDDSTLTAAVTINGKLGVGSNFSPTYTLDVRGNKLGSIAWTRTNASLVKTHKINVPADGTGWYISNTTDANTPIWCNNDGKVGINGNNSVVSYSLTVTGDTYVTGQIYATSNITAYYSDGRLKENIKPIQNPISKLMAITGVTFNSNDLAATFGYTDKSEQVGVIAQEVQKVMPQVVVPAPFDQDRTPEGVDFSKSGENYLTVKYDRLIPLLIEAVKTQQIQIDELKRLLEAK